MNHALLAGAVGVPASALLGAIYAIAGDDDDPNDWEVDVRRAIGDKEMADLILHGLPSLININMSNKIGAGTMLDPLPFVEYEASRGGYEKAVTAAMGPLIGGGPRCRPAARTSGSKRSLCPICSRRRVRRLRPKRNWRTASAPASRREGLCNRSNSATM